MHFNTLIYKLSFYFIFINYIHIYLSYQAKNRMANNKIDNYIYSIKYIAIDKKKNNFLINKNK